MRKLLLILWSTAILAGVLSVTALGQGQAHGLYATLSRTV